jgi:putative membrane protein
VSVVFNLAGQLKELLIPGLVVLFGARNSEQWQAWMMLLAVPYFGIAIGRYVSFRYRYDERELVVRWGLIFRNERHIPYARIQNLDAVQNPVHRLFGVTKVRLETGAGREPEATMSVLPIEAFDEMRRRVFEGRAEAAAVATDAEASTSATPAAPAAAGTTLLSLGPRELAVAGLIENRGMVLIAAAFGLVWELGFMEALTDRIFGEETAGRGAIRAFFAAVFGRGEVPWGQVALMLAAFAGFLIFVRVLSMVWGLIRLYGFTLTRTGEDLRSEFGLFTRVVATVPMRRIQTLTVYEGPWHRLFGWAAVRVTTAGGGAQGGDASSSQREWLAPIIGREALPGFLRQVLPEVDVAPVVWEPVHPRAFVRELRVRTVLAAVLCVGLAFVLGWWDLAAFAILAAWAAIAAHQYIRHLGWSITDRAVLFRSGWLWRHLTVARFTRIQAVTIEESPFDRRTGMASVRVDSAGGSGGHGVDIPYLPREVAGTLYQRLSTEAARTAFRW